MSKSILKTVVTLKRFEGSLLPGGLSFSLFSHYIYNITFFFTFVKCFLQLFSRFFVKGMQVYINKQLRGKTFFKVFCT